MSPQPKQPAGKQAAIDFEEIADKRLADVSAADFLNVLQQGGAPAEPKPPEELTVRDALAGGGAQQIWGGGFPEKKKIEREKQPLEKLMVEKWRPEKFIENFPEKKKFELEKLPFEKQAVERQFDPAIDVTGLGERLTAIEAKLAGLG
jgi:hypothetical protein